MAVYQLGDSFVEKFTSKSGNSRNRRMVLYQCECGDLFTSRAERPPASCGCLTKMPSDQRGSHRSWLKMRDRCLNPKHPHYDRYGGRGILICERWDNFENFFQDMGPRPDGLTLDRKNSNKGYSPDNCKWSDMVEQNRNRTNSVTIDIDGVVMSVTEWSEQPGAAYRGKIYNRLERGWSGAAAVFGKNTCRN